MSFEQFVNVIQKGLFRLPIRPETKIRLERFERKREWFRSRWRLGVDKSNPYARPTRRSTIPRHPVNLAIRTKTDPSTLLHPPMPPFSNTRHKIDSPSLLPPSGVYGIPNIPESSPCRAQLAPTRVDPQARTLRYKDTEMVEASLLGKTHVKTITGSQSPRSFNVCHPWWQSLNIDSQSLGTVSSKKVPDSDIEGSMSRLGLE